MNSGGRVGRGGDGHGLGVCTLNRRVPRKPSLAAGLMRLPIGAQREAQHNKRGVVARETSLGVIVARDVKEGVTPLDGEHVEELNN